jgi:hypothetical protein
MTALRNVIFSGFVGACLTAACTVTTGSGNFDSGVFDETGGATGTGGTSGTTGGSNVGGSTEPATTVLQCTADYVPTASPRCGDSQTACDSCLQTNNCTDAYKACWGDSQCTSLINAMMTCMLQEFESGQTDPMTASTTCQSKPEILISQPSTPSQSKAKALWDEIEASLDCTEVCCAVVTHH